MCGGGEEGEEYARRLERLEVQYRIEGRSVGGGMRSFRDEGKLKGKGELS